MDMQVCDEGGLQGITPWHTCERKQNFSTLQTEIITGSSGLCPWTAPEVAPCKKVAPSCGSSLDPMSHRRRNCGRNDNSQDLDLEMQNAATQEFEESACGVHQKYMDVAPVSGQLQKCSVPGDITENHTAIQRCLKECCKTSQCIGISVQSNGTYLQKGFMSAGESAGSVSYLHRQR